MKRQTITITSDDDTEPTTTIRVEVNGGPARISQVVFDFAPAQDSATVRPPAIDLTKLLEAVRPAATVITTDPAITAAPATATPALAVADLDADRSIADVPAAAQDAVANDTAAPAASDEHTSRTRPVKSAAKTAVTDTAAKRKTRDKTAPVSKTAPVKKALPSGQAPGKKAAPARAAAPVSGDGGRVRRMMPDDFAAVYAQASTVAGVADYYGVPTHTAQGWVKTARKRDLIAPAKTRTSR